MQAAGGMVVSFTYGVPRLRMLQQVGKSAVAMANWDSMTWPLDDNN